MIEFLSPIFSMSKRNVKSPRCQLKGEVLELLVAPDPSLERAPALFAAISPRVQSRRSLRPDL